MRRYWLAALAALFMNGIAISAHAEVKAPAAYVGLGDSLAAGQTPASEIDAGYVDLIAQELMRNQPLAFYTKDLAFPGFTTEDVLERVKSGEAQELLAAANLITVSAGANDLLRLVQTNPAEGSLSFNQLQVNFALNQARTNMEMILQELSERAPRADIYVMGYYFAYPHMRDSQKTGIAEQLDLLNEILKRSADKAGVHFVSMDGFFEEDPIDKLPNPADVHPNLEGYRAMANAFFSEYQEAWKVNGWELPEPSPLSFEEILQAREENDGSVEQNNSDEDGGSGEYSAHASEQVEMEYLAIRQAMPYI